MSAPSCWRPGRTSRPICFLRTSPAAAATSPILEHRPDASLFEIIEDCERRVISDMLEKCGWNQTDAADRFHIPLSTLNQKIKRLNIEIRKKGKENGNT